MRSRLSILLGLIIAIPALPSAQAADSRFGLSDKFGGSLPKAATVKRSRSSQRNHNDRDDRDRDDRDRDDRDRDDRDSRNSRDNRPRVVGRREPVRAFGSTLSKNKDKNQSKKGQNKAAEQMKRTETQSLGLRSYSSIKSTKTAVPIRVTGTVGQTIIRQGDRQVNAYYLESSIGRVPISAESFAKGGVQMNDLSQLVDRRVRLTGKGFFQDEARQQPRFNTISKIEYDRSQK
jgi:hypothetical protein